MKIFFLVVALAFMIAAYIAFQDDKAAEAAFDCGVAILNYLCFIHNDIVNRLEKNNKE